MIPEPPTQVTEAAELLQPAAELLDQVRNLLAIGALAVILVLAGARLERHLIKRRLTVLDGAAEGGDVDLTEGTGGNRG